MASTQDKPRLSRREFLFLLEGLAGAAVVGWLVPKSIQAIADQNVATLQPELLDELAIAAFDDGIGLVDTSAGEGGQLVCKVNEVGGAILQKLDGRTAFEQIVAQTIAGLGRQPSDQAVFAGKVAEFIAALGGAGFLKQPFYMQVIEERYVS